MCYDYTCYTYVYRILLIQIKYFPATSSEAIKFNNNLSKSQRKYFKPQACCVFNLMLITGKLSCW